MNGLSRCVRRMLVACALVVVPHDTDFTRRATLIDTPDLDGDQPAHHALADHVFRWAEAVVFVVTPEKYQMTELPPYYRLARRYATPALYAMNKCEESAVLEDYRRQLLAHTRPTEDGGEAAEGEKEEESAAGKEMTYGTKHRLLLCMYFAKLDFITPETARVLGMSRRARKRHQQQQEQDGNAPVDESDRGQEAVETPSQPKAEQLDEGEYRKAIDRLDKELASEVLALMGSISSVGGRN